MGWHIWMRPKKCIFETSSILCFHKINLYSHINKFFLLRLQIRNEEFIQKLGISFSSSFWCTTSFPSPFKIINPQFVLLDIWQDCAKLRESCCNQVLILMSNQNCNNVIFLLADELNFQWICLSFLKSQYVPELSLPLTSR